MESVVKQRRRRNTHRHTVVGGETQIVTVVGGETDTCGWDTRFIVAWLSGIIDMIFD